MAEYGFHIAVGLRSAVAHSTSYSKLVMQMRSGMDENVTKKALLNTRDETCSNPFIIRNQF